MNDLVKLLANNAELMKLVYGDLLQPGVRNVGKALATVLDSANTLLLPLRLVNEKTDALFKHHMEEFRKSLEGKPPIEIVEIPAEIGIPILERFTYVSDETCSELFHNLLSASAQKNSANKAHPSFIAVIDQMCPDEAKMLKELAYGKPSYIPHVSAEFRFKPTGAFSDMFGKLTGLERRISLQFPENVALYFENLIKLGLLKDNENRHWHGSDQLYHGLEKLYSDILTNIREAGDAEREYRVYWGYYSQTHYGELFLDAAGRKAETPKN